MLLFTVHTLPSGRRVRVRLPQRGDLPGLLALHDRAGRAISDLDARRLLRYDPRSRAVVCATAWVDGAETLVGFAAAVPGQEPGPLLADEAHAPGVTGVLRTSVREYLSRVA
ncbi:MAG: hypothetical protein ABI950_10800 [Solirubrobacteraceae bacterium]